MSDDAAGSSTMMISLEEAAQLLQCGQVILKELLASGELPGLKVGKAWVIPRAAFEVRINEMAMARSAALRAEVARQPLPVIDPPSRDGRRRGGRRPLPPPGFAWSKPPS